MSLPAVFWNGPTVLNFFQEGLAMRGFWNSTAGTMQVWCHGFAFTDGYGFGILNPLWNNWYVSISLDRFQPRDTQWMQSEGNIISNLIYPAQSHQVPCYRPKETQWRSEQNDDKFLPFDFAWDLRGIPFRVQQVWIDEIVSALWTTKKRLESIVALHFVSAFDPSTSHQVHTKYLSIIRDHQCDFRWAWTRVDATWTEPGDRKSFCEIQGRLQQLLGFRFQMVSIFFPVTVLYSNHHDFGLLFWEIFLFFTQYASRSPEASHYKR